MRYSFIDSFAEEKFSVFPACSFEFAEAAARVGISKDPDRLQVAAILPVKFEDETSPGIQHNPASEFWVTLYSFCHSEEHALAVLLFVYGTFVSRGHSSAIAIFLCGIATIRCIEIEKCQCFLSCQMGCSFML